MRGSSSFYFMLCYVMLVDSKVYLNSGARKVIKIKIINTKQISEQIMLVHKIRYNLAMSQFAIADWFIKINF